MRDHALLHVNGVPCQVRGREAFTMLADWLRKARGLPGTKIVCAEGDCGACTVLRASESPGVEAGEPPRFEAMNSCIALMAQMDGAHLVTVEGMQAGDDLAPAQEAMRRCHGSQCGFCTPGFVMAISGMLEQHGPGSVDARCARNHLTGNLCRCTGYAPIVEAGGGTRGSSCRPRLASLGVSRTVVRGGATTARGAITRTSASSASSAARLLARSLRSPSALACRRHAILRIR